MSGNLQCSILRTSAEWDAIAGQWDSLYLRLPGVTAFQGLPFLKTWWGHFQRGRSLFLVVVRDNTGIRGIAPFQLTNRRRGGFSFPTVEFLGMPDELDRPQLLVTEGDDRTLRAMLNCVTEHKSDFKMMQLDELPAKSWQAQEIERWAKESGFWVRREPLHPVPILRRDSDWSGYLARRSKHFRKRLRSAQRRADRMHKLRYAVAANSRQAQAMVDVFVSVESRSWKRDAGVDVGGQNEYRGFYRELLGGKRNLTGHAIIQYVDDQPSAATLGFSADRCYYSLQIAHDLAFNALSPGTLLEAYELEWFFSQGFDRYEFLGGAGFNKRRWTDQAIDTCCLHVRRPGVAMAAADAYRFYAKPWLQRRLGRSDERPQAPRPFRLEN